MRMNFDQLAAELTALPEEKLAKVKGGDSYFGNEYFSGTNWHSGGGGGGGGYYYYTPGYTSSGPHSGQYYNTHLGGWYNIPGGSSSGGSTTSSGYWTYVPSTGGNYYGGGSSGGGGTTYDPSTGTNQGHVTDPNGVLNSIVAGAQVRAQDAVQAWLNGQVSSANNLTFDDCNRFLSTMSQIVDEAHAVQNAGINIRVEAVPAGSISGVTHYDPATGEIVMAYQVGANDTETLINQVHEMHHVFEFLNGQLSFNKTTGEGGVLADISDEVSAYQLQHVLETGMSAWHTTLTGQTVAGDNYTVSAADVVAFGISHNLGYQNFSQTPTDINSAAGQALVAAALTGTATDVFVKP